jgi:hypothetical protein
MVNLVGPCLRVIAFQRFLEGRARELGDTGERAPDRLDGGPFSLAASSQGGPYTGIENALKAR